MCWGHLTAATSWVQGLGLIQLGDLVSYFYAWPKWELDTFFVRRNQTKLWDSLEEGRTEESLVLKPRCSWQSSTIRTFPLSLKKTSAARKNAQISRLRGRMDGQTEQRRGHSRKLKGTTGQATRGIQKAWSGNCIGTIDSNLEKNLYFQVACMATGWTLEVRHL